MSSPRLAAEEQLPSAMHIDRDRFQDQGFLILRNFLSPSRVEELRAVYEIILERQRSLWAAARGPDGPPGGEWDSNPQPRIDLVRPGLIDRRTALAVEDWVDGRMLEVASQLLTAPEASVTEMFMMCSPPHRDFGPSAWHRDINSCHMAPLQQLIDDAVESGPRYVQWNMPLYDDNVLWVVPTSHRIADSIERSDDAISRHHAPIPGGIPVELRAGDAVVYNNYILHWGSSYTRALRRTIHGGHSTYTMVPAQPILDALDQPARRHFALAALRQRRCTDLTELALRAALNRDARSFDATLSALQPGIGPKGRLVLGIYLDKLVAGLAHQLTHDVPEHLWFDQFIGRKHPITLRWGRDFTNRFTRAEAETLQERFLPLDAALRDGRCPGSRQDGYVFTDVPGLSLEEMLQSWCSRDLLPH